MGKEKADKRFVVKKSDSGVFDSIQTKVIIDKNTGVNYLWVTGGYSGGLTPLLDSAGNPIVTSVSDL